MRKRKLIEDPILVVFGKQRLNSSSSYMIDTQVLSRTKTHRAKFPSIAISDGAITSFFDF